MPNIAFVNGGLPNSPPVAPSPPPVDFHLHRAIDFSNQPAQPTNALLSVNPSSSLGTGVIMAPQASSKFAGVPNACRVYVNNAASGGPYRGEYYYADDTYDTDNVYTQHRGYALSLYWPSAYYLVAETSNNGETPFQFHYRQLLVSDGVPGVTVSDDWGGEPCIAYVKKNVLTVSFQYNYNPTSSGHPVLNTIDTIAYPGSSRNSYTVTVGTLGVDIALDTEHRIILHTVWDPRPLVKDGGPGLGFAEMWFDDIKILGPGGLDLGPYGTVSASNPVSLPGVMRLGIKEGKDFNGAAINPPGSPYPKFPMYKWGYRLAAPVAPAQFPQREIWVANWRDGSGTAFDINVVA